MTRPVIRLGAVAGVLVIGLGAADAAAGRPHTPVSPITAGAVTTMRQATVVCPDVRGSVAAQQVTWVRAAGTGADIVNGQAAITAAAVTNLPTAFAPVGQALGLIPYGYAYGGRVDHGTRALALTGTGASAVGLGAIQVTRAPSGLARGISATSCAAPGTEFAFVGGSTVVGNSLTLVLTNIDDSPAVVDVDLLGPHGPVSAPGATGLQVPAHQRLSIDLVKLGPGQPALTTLVHAVTGRVAAAESTARRDGDIPRGVEWLDDAGEASRRSLVPGMLAEPGKRTLVLADPGPDAANVRVQVVSDGGTFTPAGLDSVAVAPGSVTTVAVTAALAGHVGALLVTADQPVLAAASQELTSTTSPVTDVVWSTQTPVLTATAVVPTVPINMAAGRDVWLYLSAVHGDGTVTVTPNGPLDPTQTTFPAPVTVKVPAGTTVTADLGALLGTGSANLTVEVSADPGGGPVTAAAVFREAAKDGLMAGEVGLDAVPGVVLLPAVRQDPTVAGAQPGELEPSDSP